MNEVNRDVETAGPAASGCRRRRNGGFRESRDALEQEKTGERKILVFSPNDQLHIIVVPANVQKSVLIKEEAPEEQCPDVDQQDANCLHIKEEEEEQWTILRGEQLSMKEETDVTSFSSTAVHFKSEDDEEKPLFSQLHQHQVDVGDLPTCSSGDHIELTTGEGDKDTKKTDLNVYRDSDSSETEVSEDDEEDNDVNNPESQLKLFSRFGLKTECTDEAWASSPSRVSESSLSPNDQLHIIVVPKDVQKSVLIKEEAPDANCLHIKEEEEEPWTILGGEQLSIKEETDVTSFSLTAVHFKSEDDERKPLFSHLHQHQVEVCDLPTSSSGDHIESSTGEGEKYTNNPDLNSYRDNSDSSETEVSEDDEEYDYDVNNPESELKPLSDSGSKSEGTNKDWESSSCWVSESIVNRVHNKNGLKKFCCDVCGRRFGFKGHLNSHIRIHTGQKPFSCDLCERKFNEKGVLNRHMKIHTGQKPFYCDLCEKRFTEKGDLKRHMMIHTGQKPFCCDQCEKRFTEKSNLKKHMKIHSGQKPFCCHLCGRRFTRRDSLKGHMKIHTEQKAFSCDLCEKRFTEKSNLNRHMKIHTGQKPFCCEQCSQKFTEKGSLKKHMMIHTGQKPFSCHLCEQKFSLKGYLNAHLRIHTGQKPFCCDFCDRMFTSKANLNNHMGFHTGGEKVI